MPSSGGLMKRAVSDRCQQRVRAMCRGQWTSTTLHPVVEVRFRTTDGRWVDQLQLKSSGIARAGRGLFAARAFADGELISRYCGLRKSYPKKRSAHQYALDPDGQGKSIIDAAGAEHYLFAHFINHAAKKAANCAFRDGGLIVASRDIRQGEELFVDYGDDFVGV